MERSRIIFWILLVTGLGAALRLVAFGSVPVGLYQDEAFNGLDALRVLDGEHPIYFTANNGREPLFIYLVSLSVAGLGRTVAAVRLPAALLGTLTIPATAALGSSLFNRRLGILSSALLAVTFWPLLLSRIAFRAVALPVLLALALAAGWHGARRENRAWVLAGGVLYGLAFYTYLPVYFTPLVLLLFAFYLWATGRRAHLRRAVPYFVAGAALALVPLILAALSDPRILFGRPDQVSVFNPAINQGDLWGTLWRQTVQGLGMFFWRGDTIPRHNLPGRPIFDPVVAIFFLLGLLWALRNWRRPAAALMLFWVFLMLAPTVLAEDAPHFLRGVGILPMVCLVPAAGLEWVWRRLEQRDTARWLPVGLALLVVGFSLALTVRDYFGRYAADPLTGYAFQSAAVDLAGEIKLFDGEIWASERFEQEWESIPYLVGEKDVHWLSEGEMINLEAEPAALFFWPYDAVESHLAALPSGLRLQGWKGTLIKGDLETDPYPLYWGYWLEAGEALVAEPLASFQDHIRLEQAAVSTWQDGTVSDEGLQVVLTWSATERPTTDYVVFVHVLDTDGIVAQDDSMPASATMPTSWWRPGDSVVDEHLISMSEPYDSGRHEIAVGLYLPGSYQHLAVLDSVGSSLDDRVILTSK